MINCINNNDLDCLKAIMEDDETFLTNKICTQLLVACLEENQIVIANYITKYDFDLDAKIFENYLELNRPFTEKQITNLNKILSKFYICCLINS